MGRIRSPIAIQVNGAALLVKDPNLASASKSVFKRWQRVPGLANITLPDETGGTNETQLMDGSISFAQIAGVGTISASIGAITGHPVHRMLAEKRRDGGSVEALILRPAIAISGGTGATATTGVATASIGPKITIASGGRDWVKNNVREGTLVGKTGAKGFVGDGDTAAAETKWRSVLWVSDDGDEIVVDGDFDSAQTTAFALAARRPGILYTGGGLSSCSVNGFGDGDFQAGGAMNANLSLAPATALTSMQPEWRLITELASTTGPDYAGSDTTSPGPYDGVFA